ncbi:LLM class flavin-dependent oxidoreductase [Nocardia sp. NPDC057353]|uniref:LLM class flavin-dependent oxidoreductase n=1 Tax=Nocardia sp. NPDC057353 TaxID=3346104 RepID=UPI0036342B44
MQFGVCLPCLGEFAEPRRVAELGREAEEGGWDGVFVWDHVVFPFGEVEVADPWVLLTLLAAATTRIRLGPLVTPVARRRPGTLARQTASVDRLANGRLVFGAGLGFTLDAEYGSWGEPVEPSAVAARLDEGLDLLARLWSGEPVSFRGKHLHAEVGAFLPAPARRPPIWIGGNWPSLPPLRRAARWDGFAPMIIGPDGSFTPTPEVVRDIEAHLADLRAAGTLSPAAAGVAVGAPAAVGDPPPERAFDLVVTGSTDGAEPRRAADTTAAVEEAGATWWLEGFGPGPGEFERARRRIGAGPPR